MQNNTVFFIAIIIAGTVVLTLTAVAIALHIKLHRVKKQQAERLAEQEKKAIALREQAVNSLRIIAKSYLTEQVELAEASIRVSKLMDNLGFSDQERMPYRVFDEVAKRLAHIPIKEAWKVLPKLEKRTHTRTISAVEAEFCDFAKPAAEQMAVIGLSKSQFYEVK